ncbi:acyltransferase [Dankookia rubra]|uniref:Acyltransferase n=1 Tax=Dankookia rubra TaxID=1442381 RepID=A0A4R5Q7E0_9PROT|nr:acyltransferase [Dankookia rubra]TDH58181.1 acyltransferase [Dankookia rubra]
MDRGQLIEIQALRAFAALAVVAYHAADRAGSAFGVGAAGVDVFFVISGFIMMTVTAARPTTPLRFAWNRISRIVPLYWLVTLALVGLALVLPAAMPNLQASPDRVVQSLLFIPHRDPAGQIFPVLVPGWTLNFEMFFYALFAAALVLPRSAQLAAITAMMLGLVGLGVLLRPDGAVAATYTSPMLLEFLAGIWLAQLRLRGRLPRRQIGLAMLALGLAAYAALQATRTYSDAWRVVLWGGPALLIVAGTLAAAPALRPGLAKRLGDASYSIYLLHPLLVGVVWRFVGWLPAPGFLLASLLVSALAGLACFTLLEQPLTEALKRRRRSASPSRLRAA